MQLSIGDVNIVLKEAYSRLERKEYDRALSLFERIFDGKNAAIASCMGVIYSKRDYKNHDVIKAKKFFQIAAEQGNTYAQNALAGLLREDGEIEDAIQWYKKASDGGESVCSYMLYRYFKTRGDLEAAYQYLMLSVEQGNPLALQHLAMRYVRGSFGIAGIFKGICMAFKNIPNLVRFLNEYEHS